MANYQFFSRLFYFIFISQENSGSNKYHYSSVCKNNRGIQYRYKLCRFKSMNYISKIILIIICIIGVYATPTGAGATTKQVYYSGGQNASADRSGPPIVTISNALEFFSVV